MMNWLRFSTAIALFALFGIFLSSLRTPLPEVATVLPKSAISKTTQEEQTEIRRRFSRISGPHPLTYGVLAVVTFSNCIALFLANRGRRKAV
jgi:hypothetical protein